MSINKCINIVSFSLSLGGRYDFVLILMGSMLWLLILYKKIFKTILLSHENVMHNWLTWYSVTNLTLMIIYIELSLEKNHVTCDFVIYETQSGKPVYPSLRYLLELISRLCVNLFAAHQICAHFLCELVCRTFLTPKLKWFCYKISILKNLVLLFRSLIFFPWG